MHSKEIKCIKRVGAIVHCPHCKGVSIKYGRSKQKVQRYRCKSCSKIFQLFYVNNAYATATNDSIKAHLKECCGIRSIARLLKISATTVIRRIVNIAKTITKPLIVGGKVYEVDELRTYVNRKANLRWIVYALRRDTKEVVDFAVGPRTNEMLKLVTDTLVLSAANKIHTDKLLQYASIIPKEIHCTRRFGTNSIERNNLTPSSP